MCFIPVRLAVGLAMTTTMVLSSGAQQKASATVVNDGFFSDWAARSIGPANMGGRISCITFAPGDAKKYYIGFATGGIFRTNDDGTSFEPVFEHYPTASIGSIAVCDAPKNWKGWDDQKSIAPDKRETEGKARIIWVGSGEGNGRNSSSWGDGMYRSVDGGASFQKVGLDGIGDIPALAVDPENPDVCYAASMGHLWGPNKDRGIYKTSDGGKTWKPILQGDDHTGAIDVVMVPGHPNELFAAMYSRLRTPYGFSGGSLTGGIFKTDDGGAHWTKLAKGLPNETGRIGLAVSASKPGVIMATIESSEGGPRDLFDDRSRVGGVFRSEDEGKTWTRTSVLDPRAFYFSKIRIDPNNDKSVYILGFTIYKSEDGGYTFKNGIADREHSDWHALSIDPKDSDHVVIGGDGGLFQTQSGCKTWAFLNDIAAGEFYNIDVDRSTPYRIAGGLQDNGCWLGVSATQVNDITNGEWRTINGGDGFHVAFDPSDPDLVYSESQGGGLDRLNLKTGSGMPLNPVPPEGGTAYRFNWNTPFFVSHHDPSVIYEGGNRVFKFTKKGADVAVISPDLTTMDPVKMASSGSGAEAYCTIVALAESPVTAGLLWAGSDDGLIHVTTDDGAHWSNVTPPAVKGRYVANIDPGHEDSKVAYAAIDGHRSDDYSPCALMTTDLGKTWTDITGNLPKDNSVRVVKEVPGNPNALVAGTEIGVYLTLDRGKTWVKMAGSSLPTVSVQDIAFQPDTHDMVLATHGRSIYIIDGIYEALSELTPAVIAEPLHPCATIPTMPTFGGYRGGEDGNSGFHGQNPNREMSIPYWVGKAGGGVQIEVLDKHGAVVSRLSGPGSAGLHRLYWNMQPLPDLSLPNRGQEGPVLVAPGTYTLKFTMDGVTATTTAVVLPNGADGILPVPPMTGEHPEND